MSSLFSSIAKRVINDLTLGGSGEPARQEAENDKTFSRSGLYYLELVLGSDRNSYFFPFMVSPRSVQFSEPFSVEATPTQGSGLYVEENGIVMRRIRMAGNFGFMPRPLAGNAPAGGVMVSAADDKDWVRSLPPAVISAVSGQRHMQYLQDAVIRTYSAYKKSPEFAENTHLIWHSVRDDEHWLVAPETFDISQSTSSPMTFDYDISFIVKAPDDGQVFAVGDPDKSFLDVARDTARSLQKAVDRVNGSLQDLTALTGQITTTSKDFANIVVSAGNIFTNVSNLVQGVAAIIESPFAAVLAVADGIDNLLQTEYALSNFGKFGGYPALVRQRFLSLQQSSDEVMQHPQVFATSAQQRLTAFYAAQQDPGTANLTAAPGAMNQYAEVGTSNLPGQAAINDANLGTQAPAVPQFTGTHDYVVRQGDSLLSIASAQMNNASLWSFLAEYNRLAPPFVSAQPAAAAPPVSDDAPPTGTLLVGQVLQVPDYSTPPEDIPNLPLLGVRPSEPADVHLYGRDLMAQYTPRGGGGMVMDLVIDAAHGSTDFATVQGVDNLQQLLQTQVSVEAGSDLLYPSVGLMPLVGSGVTALDVQMRTLRVRQSLLQDARISQVTNVEVDNLDGQGNPQGDLLNISATVIPVSGGAPQRLALSV